MSRYSMFCSLGAMIFISTLIGSCERSSADKIGYTDTLKYDGAYDTFNEPVPTQGIQKKYRIKEIEGFCLNRKYKPFLLQNIELISTQEEFEKIASKDCDTLGVYSSYLASKSDTINPYPYIDFSNTRIVAVIIDNAIDNPDGKGGFKDIDILYKLDSCVRGFNGIGIYFTLQVNRVYEDYEHHKFLPRQLFLYHIKLDENLERIRVMNSNGMSGSNLEVKAKANVNE